MEIKKNNNTTLISESFGAGRGVDVSFTDNKNGVVNYVNIYINGFENVQAENEFTISIRSIEFHGQLHLREMAACLNQAIEIIDGIEVAKELKDGS